MNEKDMDDLIRSLVAESRKANDVAPASESDLEWLREQGLPPDMIRWYAMHNGGGAGGMRFFPAAQVRRGHGDIDAQSVRGQIVFGDNRRDHHLREVYCVDHTGFFGLGKDAIARGQVPLKWGWSRLVAPDTAAFFAMIARGAPRASSIPKKARAQLTRAIAKNSKSVTVTPGPADDPYKKKLQDPDRISYNFKHDGRTYLPWAITHLYYLLDGMSIGEGAIVVRPFMELERTPWPDLRGFLFARGDGAVFLVTMETGGALRDLPEGLVVKVVGEDPSTARVLGHLLDVVTQWVKGARPEGMTMAEWTGIHGR
jgi:hypothetical protein